MNFTGRSSMPSVRPALVDRLRSGVIAFAIVISATSIVGCSGTASLGSWRERVTRLVVEEGHGDPAVLRDVTRWRSPRVIRPAQMVMGKLSGESGPLDFALGGKDVQGVLVDTAKVGNDLWFFFMVGVTPSSGSEATSPTDIRLVAMTARPDRLRWHTGRPNATALNRYLQERMKLKSGTPSSGRGFPSDFDHFRLQVEGRMATVVEAHSRASWSVEL